MKITAVVVSITLAALVALAIVVNMMRQTGDRSRTISGTYSTTSSPPTDLDKELNWKFLADGTVLIGDEQLPESVIAGRWSLTNDRKVKVRIISVGGQDATKVPKTSDTRLLWLFETTWASGRCMYMVSDNKLLKLSRK